MKSFFDIAVIGAGSAGLSAFHTASRLKKSVCLIEGGAYGTSCARSACMPSKILISQSHRYFTSAAHTRVDVSRILKDLRNQRDEFVLEVVRESMRIDPELRFCAKAKFLDSNTLDVGGVQIHARAIIIATGSKPVLPSALLPFSDRILTTEQIFEIKEGFRSLAVLGSGASGLEIAQSFHRLSVDVTLFAGNNFSIFKDLDLQKQVRQLFADQMTVREFSEIQSVSCLGKKIIVKTSTNNTNKGQEDVYDFLLCALGRIPDLDGLALQNAGILQDDQNHILYDPLTLSTSLPHVFVAGDANGKRMLQHEAVEEGRIAAQNAINFLDRTSQSPSDSKVFYRKTPSVQISFTSPQMASCFFEDFEKRADFLRVYVNFSESVRARLERKDEGAVVLFADFSGNFLGAEIFCEGAEHLIHLLAWVLQLRMKVDEIISLVFSHPCYEEILKIAFKRLHSLVKSGVKPK